MDFSISVMAVSSSHRGVGSSSNFVLDPCGARRDDGAVSRYRQYCPVARASEVLAERWNPLIIRNVMFGAHSFTAIAAGLPTMSRSVLTSRLRDLAGAGVLEIRPKPNGSGSTYHLTEAGAGLAPVIDAMATWAEEHVEVLPAHADPGFALWAWAQVQTDRDALPSRRTVVAFDFVEERPGDRFFWVLAYNGEIEVCLTDPGGEAELRVTARSLPFIDWHRGRRSWADVIRSGDVVVDGPPTLARSFPRWNHRSVVLDG